MNRTMFMNELRERLKHLPYEDFNDVINFYEEYFDEAGVENEQQVIKDLGCPQKVASKIIGDFAFKEDGYSIKKGMGISKLWIVVLAIFASPIALPISIALIATVFGLLVALFFMIVGFGMGAIGMVVGGIGGIVKSLATFIFNPIDSIWGLGASMVTFAFGSFVLLAICFLGSKGIAFITRLLAGFLNGRNSSV